MARLVCDSRERGVWAALNEFESVPGIELSTAQLDVGDFEIIVSAPKPTDNDEAAEGGEAARVEKRIVVERKAWDDHCASIVDGRHKEQTARALAMREQQAPNVTYVLLVEGVVPGWDGQTGPLKNKSAHAALIKSAIRDSVPVLFCRDKLHTANTLLYLAHTARSGGLDPATKAAERAASGYAGVVKFSKKKANTAEELWNVMLSSIPGVSGAKAAAISAQYPTPAALVGTYQEAVRLGKRKKSIDLMLADVPCGKGRLGPALSKKLCDAFGPPA